MSKKIALTICSIVVLSGCYTQFAVVRREPPPPQVVYEVDSLGDTVKVVHSTDTVVKERENCYWTRNLWGQPEWRCGSPFYSNSWYLYNDYPWWYSSYPYYYDFNGRCPQYYYYDASCGSCRRYGESGRYLSNYNRGGHNGGGGIVAPSSTAPSAHRSRVTPVTNQSPAAPSVSNPNIYGAGVPKIETPSNNTPAIVNPGPSSPAPVAQQPATIQSSPPPSSSSPPPSNSSGGASGNNEQRHRNPRSR